MQSGFDTTTITTCCGTFPIAARNAQAREDLFPTSIGVKFLDTVLSYFLFTDILPCYFKTQHFASLIENRIATQHFMEVQPRWGQSKYQTTKPTLVRTPAWPAGRTSAALDQETPGEADAEKRRAEFGSAQDNPPMPKRAQESL